MQDTLDNWYSTLNQCFKELCTKEYEGYTHIYTDGSKLDSNNYSAAALVIPELTYEDQWKIQSENIVTAELIAILKALQFTIQFLKGINIVIFTDSQSAISIIGGYSLSFRTIVYAIHSCFESIIADGRKIKIQWIPSHCGIQGNESADQLAKAANNRPSWTQIETPLSDLQAKCKKAIWHKWQQERKNELILSNLGKLREKNYLEPLVTSLKEKRLNTAIIRLRIGHCGLRQHLHRLKLEDSPRCECGQEEDVKHVLLSCPKYYTARVIFKQALFKHKIPFTLSHILGSDKDPPEKIKILFRHLAVFIKSTKLIERI